MKSWLSGENIVLMLLFLTNFSSASTYMFTSQHMIFCSFSVYMYTFSSHQSRSSTSLVFHNNLRNKKGRLVTSDFRIN